MYRQMKRTTWLQSMVSLTPLSNLRVSTHLIPAFHDIPNTSIQGKPLMIYHNAFDGSATEMEDYLIGTGIVKPQWRYTMYSTTHFHSTTHEVLSIISGSARLCFGGEENPGRVETDVERGDVVIIPAGLAHRLLEDHGAFEMIGSYPLGYKWDMCYGTPQEEEKIQGIKTLPWFTKDPIYAEGGPALSV